jgi:hypothetical protein
VALSFSDSRFIRPDGIRTSAAGTLFDLLVPIAVHARLPAMSLRNLLEYLQAACSATLGCTRDIKALSGRRSVVSMCTPARAQGPRMSEAEMVDTFTKAGLDTEIATSLG